MRGRHAILIEDIDRVESMNQKWQTLCVDDF